VHRQRAADNWFGRRCHAAVSSTLLGEFFYSGVGRRLLTIASGARHRPRAGVRNCCLRPPDRRRPAFQCRRCPRLLLLLVRASASSPGSAGRSCESGSKRGVREGFRPPAGACPRPRWVVLRCWRRSASPPTQVSAAIAASAMPCSGTRSGRLLSEVVGTSWFRRSSLARGLMTVQLIAIKGRS